MQLSLWRTWGTNTNGFTFVFAVVFPLTPPLLDWTLDLSVVVSAWVFTGVPALLLGVWNSFQVAIDGGTGVVEPVKAIFWKHKYLSALCDYRLTEQVHLLT